MTMSRRCPKCQSTDIRWMEVSADGFASGQVGPVTIAFPGPLAVSRLFEVYVYGSCRFSEFYLRM